MGRGTVGGNTKQNKRLSQIFDIAIFCGHEVLHHLSGKKNKQKKVGMEKETEQGRFLFYFLKCVFNIICENYVSFFFLSFLPSLSEIYKRDFGLKLLNRRNNAIMNNG